VSIALDFLAQETQVALFSILSLCILFNQTEVKIGSCVQFHHQMEQMMSC